MLVALGRRGARRLRYAAAAALSTMQSTRRRLRRPASIGRNRLVVLDPGLMSAGGHHLEFARILKAHFSATHDVALFGNATAGLGLVATLGVRPLFGVDLYPRALGAPFPPTYDRMTRSMSRSLSRINGGTFGPDTIVVSHTTTVFQIGALAAWYESLPPRQRPRLFVQFQHPLEFMVEPQSHHADAIRLARDAAGRLDSAGCVRFAANSATLAQTLQTQLGQPCALMPIPVCWPLAARVGRPDPGVTFGFFGGLRPEKGAAILPGAIAAFGARFPDAHFIVHAPRGPSDETVVRELARLPGVELVRTTFERKADYFDCLARARWILLPYDPAAYATRTSGVFIEAQGLGIPVVVSPQTWMAAQLPACGRGGIVLANFSAAALAAGLERARATMLLAAADAPVPDPATMAEHCPANFCARLLALTQAPAAALI